MCEDHVCAGALKRQPEERAVAGSYEPPWKCQEPNPELVDLLSFLGLLMF